MLCQGITCLWQILGSTNVVPDLWDDSFLPVRKGRSGVAHIPAESPRGRARRYGAYYVPSNKWSEMFDGGLRSEHHSASTDEELAAVSTDMAAEIKKLHSSRAFTNYIKSKGLRLPQYLREGNS